MDHRLTLNMDESFLPMLEEALRSQKTVHLLVDENGISRMEGCVVKLEGQDIWLKLQSGEDRIIHLKELVALDGVFRPEYGEC